MRECGSGGGGGGGGGGISVPPCHSELGTCIKLTVQSRNSIKIKGRKKGGTDLLLMNCMVSIATFMKESRSGSVTAPSKPVRTLCSASADHDIRQTPSTGLRHPSSSEKSVPRKRGLAQGHCKLVLGVWLLGVWTVRRPC